jgi:hypothetical protein
MNNNISQYDNTSVYCDLKRTIAVKAQAELISARFAKGEVRGDDPRREGGGKMTDRKARFSTLQASGKKPCSVILSEAKNLSSIYA